MKQATLSVVFTVHDRSYEVLEAVHGSLQNQDYDQVCICLDRSPKATRDAVHELWTLAKRPAEVVEIAGVPEWRGPARAMNAALSRVTSEITLMLSSETIQGPDNIKLAREILSRRQCVLFGKAEDSSGTPQVVGFPPGLLCSSEYPRPLGFTWAVPTWALRAIGGYDEEFMKGLCYDDDDISYRLWKLGLPFVFHDGMTGIHQFHERPGLNSAEGQAKIAINRLYLRDKFSADTLPEPRENPLNALYHTGRILETRQPGITTWQQLPVERSRARFSL